MRLAAILLTVVALGGGCDEAGSTPVAATPSSTQKEFGTATLSETACAFAMPDKMPLEVVRFKIVNNTKYTGRYILGHIHDGHTFNELLDYWNGPMGQVKEADFATQIEFADVSAGGSDVMLASVTAPGVYAFHCGYYSPDAGKVIGFWHELRAG